MGDVVLSNAFDYMGKSFLHLLTTEINSNLSLFRPREAPEKKKVPFQHGLLRVFFPT